MTIAEVSQQYGLTPDTLRYYERVGIIPPVHRTGGGQRDYTPQDCQWVEQAKCMRGAGLSVEVLAEYLKLVQQGDSTLAARCALLQEQHAALVAQRDTIDETLARLEYKIGRYKEAVKTGALHWE